MKNFQLEKRQKRNPMAEYLLKLQMIVTNTEFKDKEEADKYETLAMKLKGDMYCNAVLQQDKFETYAYDKKRTYQLLLENGVDELKIPYYVENPQFIPTNVKNIMLAEARETMIATYVEENPYYVALTGKPFQGSDTIQPEYILTIPDEFFDIYQNTGAIERNQAIHEMPVKYQELFMNTDYYKEMLDKYPEHKYLKYLGSRSIPIQVSRKARDGEIMKINTNALTGSHPVFGNISVESDLVHLFTNQYLEVRQYIYGALRGDFADIYANYNSFIRFLTIYMTIGSCLNELMKKSASMIYMNQSTANDFFMLYGLPSVIMEGADMISFLKQFRLILMDKGTNIVYRVKDLIGYEYTDIYTLVMVKQQVFENGLPKYTTDESGNRVPVQEIVFRRLGTTDENVSYFKFKEGSASYPWKEIATGDPRWWDTPEVERMLYTMNYTLSNSKYIQLSTHLSMVDIYWQCVILIRGLLDNRYETEHINIALNLNLNGKSNLSIFETVLILEILMNWSIKTVRGDHLRGDLYLPNGDYQGSPDCIDMLFNGLKYYDPVDYPDVTREEDGAPNPLKPGQPFKVSSFNFDLRETDAEFWRNEVPEMDYILSPGLGITNETSMVVDGVETVIPQFIADLDYIFNRTENNIGESLMGNVRKVYDYLEQKLQESRTIDEYRQVTDMFNHLFLVDPERNWFDDGAIDTDAFLKETYSLSEYELSSLKSFFEPHAVDFTVEYDNREVPISIYDIMNEDVYALELVDGKFYFQEDNFVDAFDAALRAYHSNALETSNISPNVKTVYKEVIHDKVSMDLGNSIMGPRTFEALLYRNDPEMYRYLVTLKTDSDSLLIILRSLVKSLESYTNASLRGLEFASIGLENYFKILKEVIGYFKSYMVEYAKEEFVYLFDGLWDNGGNSNMLRLYDERAHLTLRMVVRDSLTLHDASHALNKFKTGDLGLTGVHDEMQVRRRVAYKKVKELGYDIIFDTGKRVTKFPDNLPGDDDKVVFSLYEYGDSYQVRIYL